MAEEPHMLDYGRTLPFGKVDIRTLADGTVQIELFGWALSPVSHPGSASRSLLCANGCGLPSRRS